MPAYVIWDDDRKALYVAGDLCVGVVPSSVSSALLVWEDATRAANGRDGLCKLLGKEPARLRLFRLKQGSGTLDERIKKRDAESYSRKGIKIYCGRCGRRISPTFVRATGGVPLTGQALEHGEFVTVHLCSAQCQLALSTENERKLECLDQEMVALRNGEAVLKTLKAVVRERAREASRSPKQESGLATSLPS